MIPGSTVHSSAGNSSNRLVLLLLWVILALLIADFTLKRSGDAIRSESNSAPVSGNLQMLQKQDFRAVEAKAVSLNGSPTDIRKESETIRPRSSPSPCPTAAEISGGPLEGPFGAPAACPKERRVRYVSNYTKFILEVFKASQHAAPLSQGKRAIDHIMSHWSSEFNRTVPQQGIAMEFGVFIGSTLKKTALALRGAGFQGYIGGFDSFQGLPEAWGDMPKGAFGEFVKFGRKGAKKITDIEGVARRTVNDPSVSFERGWFQDTIPAALTRGPAPDRLEKDIILGKPLSHLHIDGDLFISAEIPLQLLNSKIVPGTIITFDELYANPGYDKNEMLALYLWLGQNSAADKQQQARGRRREGGGAGAAGHDDDDGKLEEDQHAHHHDSTTELCAVACKTAMYEDRGHLDLPQSRNAPEWKERGFDQWGPDDESISFQVIRR